MSINDQYINSVNLNAGSDFPYLVLNVKDDDIWPRNLGFRVIHWHIDLQFVYVLGGIVRVRTLEEEIRLTAGQGIFINKDVVHLIDKVGTCEYKSFIFPDYFVSFYPGSPAAQLTQRVTADKSIQLIPFTGLLHGKKDSCHLSRTGTVGRSKKGTPLLL